MVLGQGPPLEQQAFIPHLIWDDCVNYQQKTNVWLMVFLTLSLQKESQCSGSPTCVNTHRGGTGGGRALDVTIAKHPGESVLRGKETPTQTVCFPLGPHLMPDAVLCLCTKAGADREKAWAGMSPRPRFMQIPALEPRWLWAGYVTFLSLPFLICTMGLM